MKKNGNCNYYGNFGHYVYECRKNKYNEYKNKKYEVNCVNSHQDTITSDNLHDLKLFVSDFSLSVESSDCNDWFIDSEASIHMSCHKSWIKIFKRRMMVE